MATPALAIALIAAQAPDTTIADVEEPPFRPVAMETRPAAPVTPAALPHREVIVQVQIAGREGRPTWHRYLAQTGGLLTACDDPQTVRSTEILDLRIEQYDGEMCR